uniref:Uncharacterized protein n=1 Tax=Meloidogyne enterolobii TaxID=390850 RepID=A0A6V7WWQ7_MELEN|nr:unnamed protein product [Meloidogyne enterolobii]
MRNLRVVRLKNVMAGDIIVGDLLEEDVEVDIITNTNKHLHHSGHYRHSLPTINNNLKFTMKFNVQL